MVASESSLLGLQRVIYKFYGTTSLIKGIVSFVVGRFKTFLYLLGLHKASVSYPSLA